MAEISETSMGAVVSTDKPAEGLNNEESEQDSEETTIEPIGWEGQEETGESAEMARLITLADNQAAKASPNEKYRGNPSTKQVKEEVLEKSLTLFGKTTKVITKANNEI